MWRTRAAREGGCEVNLYVVRGSGLGTTEAQSLSARLSAWHDAMVAHERRLRTDTTGDLCDDECPHAEARSLWSEAVEAFGPRAHELTFLRSRAIDSTRHSKAGVTSEAQVAKTAGAGRPLSRTRETQEARSLVAADTVRAVELQS